MLKNKSMLRLDSKVADDLTDGDVSGNISIFCSCSKFRKRMCPFSFLQMLSHLVLSSSAPNFPTLYI